MLEEEDVKSEDPVVDSVSQAGTRHLESWHRRKFMKSLAAAAGSVGLLGYDRKPGCAEPPAEVRRIRLTATPAVCVAPKYLAEELLRAEGFDEVNYLKLDVSSRRETGSGQADFDLDSVGDIIVDIDAGVPIVVLAGLHLGCYELFGTERVQAIRDLKGKTIAIDGFGNPQHVFLSRMTAYVGLDPRKDINWVVGSSAESMKRFAEGRVDAFLGFPPEPQELRARKIGHVVVNTAVDRPWAQYYCCMLIGNREFVRKHPVATKRAIRAILKAADLCAQEPERAARIMVDKGFTQRYDFALEAPKEVSYKAWREYDPDNTVRFHALRLHEVGMIKSIPQKIIAQGTDWRFLNELKKELKA
jgi:NitT/TauT family transport system substrate-binding protein